MEVGDLVAGRFTIERIAGRGGMGTVFRARDAQTGGPVALKVLHASGGGVSVRFDREVELLSEMKHPAIVAYVAHGVTADRQPFLAMEWLDGEDLERRLENGQTLSVKDAILLGRRVASGLAILHRHAIVHRDVKPSNILLVGGSISQAKLLDLGVARSMPRKTRVTRVGSAIGTPGYMAPEQARGEAAVDARADVFALGCVLFECVAGRPAFKGDHPVAVLARILLEEAPRLAEFAGVPKELEQLVASMLSKLADDRPRDAGEVMAALERLAPMVLAGPTSPEETMPTSVRRLTTVEQRLVTIVLAGGAAALTGTMASEETGFDDRARTEIERVPGAKLDVLADGSWLVVFAGEGEATDRAARAAATALRLRRVLREAPIAVATGRLVVRTALPIGDGPQLGEALDFAANTLNQVGPPAIAVDETTSELLQGRFNVVPRGALRELGAERPLAVARTLLGKPTPTVGRDRQLGVLRAVLDECTSESAARVVVVTAAAGVGKTRLVQEFLKRLPADYPAVIFARGDPASAGSPLSLAAQIVTRAAGIHDGEGTNARRLKIRTRFDSEESAEEHLADFLGEYVGAPSVAESDALRTARRDPLVMGDQMHRAFEQLLAIETADKMILVVLEDLHWGDRASVSWIDGALKTLRDRPLMVLAAARPDVFEIFPKLWSSVAMTEIGLPELSKRAAESLVRHVLGADVEADLVERIVGQAGGNAFFLEELIRSAARGDEALPTSVMAMVEAQLDALEPTARRVLRAASVLGHVFPEGAVSQLIAGKDGPRAEVHDQLAVLVERELLERRAESRFAGEPELAFRHALVREAAYGTLLDEDRVLAHRSAGKWLERAGERDPLVLAEHYKKGGAVDRALVFYRKAAEQALAGDDFDAVLEHVAEARRAGASGELLGELLLLEAEAQRWSGDAEGQLRVAREAMGHLNRGSSSWFAAASEVATATARLGDFLKLPPLAEALRTATRAPEASRAVVAALLRVTVLLLQGGRMNDASVVFAEAEALRASAPADPSIDALVAAARVSFALAASSPAVALEQARLETQAWQLAGNLRSLCLARVHLAEVSHALGAYADAEAALVAAVADAERMHLDTVVAIAKKDLAATMTRTGRVEEAAPIAIEACRALAENKRQQADCHRVLAEIAMARGDVDTARTEAQTAAERLRGLPLALPALAIAAEAKLSAGNYYNALAIARDGIELLERLGHGEEGESHVRLVHAEALHANGERGAAAKAIAIARTTMLERAAAISDEKIREGFLAVSENRRTLALADAWKVPP